MTDITGTNAGETLNGTPDADSISGYGGDDTINGGDGNDRIYGEFGEVSFSGGGNDTLNGGAGNDFIWGNSGDDIINGDGGDDGLFGGMGADHLDGGDGNDFLSGFEARVYGPLDDNQPDVLIGGAGNDTFEVSFGDSADGGSGNDEVYIYLFAAPAGVSVDFRQLTNGGSVVIGGGVLTGIEYVGNIGGSNFNDILIAGAVIGPNGPMIRGEDGDDQLTGSSANDTIWGGNGNDIIYGGVGFNAAIVPSTDRIFGEAGNDIIYSGPDGAEISGGIGDDTIFSGTGNDTIRGDDGNDTVSYALATSGVSVSLAVTGFTQNTGGGGVDAIQTVENLSGSAFADLLSGNSLSNILSGGLGVDRLTGGAGIDTFRDTAAGLNGDTLVDFVSGEKIIITDVSYADISFNLSGNILSYTGGSLILGSAPSGSFFAAPAAGGGVELSIQSLVSFGVTNDFNGDTRSDLLLRNLQDGWLTDWLGVTDGTLVNNGSKASNHFPTDWKVTGIGDYNGDGQNDFLLRNDAGWLTNWLGTANGGFANNGANTSLFFAPEWKVTGSGDFNGDRRDDLLLRRDDGWLTNWLGTANGSFTNNGATTSLFFTPDWKVVSTGDFNGDSYTDILLRRDDGWVTNWLGNSSGGFTNNGANTALFFTLDWKVIGTGDINADGKDDLILRRDDGWITDWLGTVNGGFTNNGANTALFLTTDWKISSIADFNGDGREDILLRNDSGWMTNWLGTDTGSFANNGANFSTYIAPSWVVQDPFL